MAAPAAGKPPRPVAIMWAPLHAFRGRTAERWRTNRMSSRAPPGNPPVAGDDSPSEDAFFGLPEALGPACLEAWRRIVADPPRSFALATGVTEKGRGRLDRAWAGLCAAYHRIRGGELAQASGDLERARELFGGLADPRGEALAAVTGAYLDIARGEPDRALATLEDVVHSHARSERIAPLDQFLAYHALALAYGRLGNLELALQHHYANLQLLERFGTPSPLAVVLLNLSSTLMSIDDWEESLALAQRAVSCCARLDNATLKRRAEVNVALACRFLGRMEEALALLERLRAEPFRDAGSDFALYINSAEALVHAGHIADGERWLTRARQCARADGDLHERANLTWVSGLIAARSGDLPGAIARLEAAKGDVAALRKLHVPLLPRVVEVLAECYARSGDHARAFETFQQFHASFEARLGYTTRARYAGRKTRQGVAAIGNALWREAGEARSSRDRSAEHARLNEALRRTLAASGDEDGGALPGWGARSIARIDVEARELGVEARHIGGLVESLNRASGASGNEGDAQEVRVLVLGGFEIRVRGRPLSFGRKRPERPLALLKYLAAQGTREVPEVEVADTLWPDLDGDAALGALAVSLHRLRHLLGGTDTVAHHERRLAIDSRRVWCDAAAFETMLDRAAASASDDERDRLARGALAIYRGDLEVDEDREPWALAPRRRLRERFLTASAAQGARFAAAACWDEARESFARGLEKDELAEELCLGLMHAYLALGRPEQGVAAYRGLERALESQRGTRPHAALEGLYRELLARLR